MMFEREFEFTVQDSLEVCEERIRRLGISERDAEGKLEFFYQSIERDTDSLTATFTSSNKLRRSLEAKLIRLPDDTTHVQGYVSVRDFYYLPCFLLGLIILGFPCGVFFDQGENANSLYPYLNKPLINSVIDGLIITAFFAFLIIMLTLWSAFATPRSVIKAFKNTLTPSKDKKKRA